MIAEKEELQFSHNESENLTILRKQEVDKIHKPGWSREKTKCLILKHKFVSEVPDILKKINSRSIATR